MLHLFLFTLLSAFLLAVEESPYKVAAFGGEPDAIVGGCINVITGDVAFQKEDLVVAGKQPITIKRRYFSRDGEIASGGWTYFFDSLTLTHLWPEKQGSVLLIPEKEGFDLLYGGEPQESGEGLWMYDLIDDSSMSLTNGYTGTISARFNARNNVVFRNPNTKREILVQAADGSRRCYHLFDKTLQQGRDFYVYSLTHEVLANQNKIHYQWTLIHNDRYLTRIKSTDPHGKEYARVDIEYDFQNPTHLRKIDLKTSDNQTLTYHFDAHAKNGDHKYRLLKKAIRPTLPNETFHYWKPPKKGYLLDCDDRPDQRKRHFHFYAVGDNSVYGQTVTIPNAKSKRYKRVRILETPVGKKGKMHPAYQFIYKAGEYRKKGGHTNVIDGEKNVTRYCYDKHLVLTQIHHCDKRGATLFSEHFFRYPFRSSKSNWIKRRVLLDASNTFILAHEYQYDVYGNLEEETLVGNLTGEDLSGRYAVSRTFYPSHLLKSESFPNGKSIHYRYLEGTDLIAAKYTYDQDVIQQRHFYEYVGNILVKEIVDDGFTADSHTLSGVSERLIKEITVDPQTDLPQVVQEYGCDLEAGKRCLLRKKVIHYNDRLQIAQTDHYDAENCMRYSLHYEYDERGRLIRETNPLGQSTSYTYDENNNKVAQKRADEAFERTFTYDAANRVTQSTQKTEKGDVRQTTYGYSGLSQKISQTDHQNNTTLFSYDSLGNITEVQSPLFFDLDSDSLKRPVTQKVYAAPHFPVAETDALGNVTKTQWTIRKKPYLITYPDQTKESFVYDLNGNLIKHVNAVGTVTLSTFDFLDRLTSKKIYSKEGTLLSVETYCYNVFHLLSKTAPDGTVTEYTYDYGGRLVQEKTLDHVTQYAYDSLGRLEKTLYTIEENAQVHTKKYDLLGRVIQERQEDLEGNVYFWVAYEYDPYGNKTAIKTEDSVATFEYDSFSRLIKKTDPLENTTIIQYQERFQSDHGCLYLAKTTTAPSNSQTIEHFNHAGYPIHLEKRAPNGAILLQEAFFYNSKQEKIAQISKLSKPITKKWEYDLRGKVRAIHEGQVRTNTYSYTPDGHLKTWTKPDQTTLHYSYDPLGRLLSLSAPDLTYTLSYDLRGNIIASTDGKTAITRTYDPFNNLLQETLPSGLITHTYDSLNRPLSLTLPDSSSVYYHYDPYHLHTIERLDNDQTLQYSHLIPTYDLRHHPLIEILPNQLTLMHSINPLGRLVETSSARSTQAITAFDSNNNVLEYSQVQTNSYAYDPLDQLISEEGTFWYNYTYDARHNRLTKNLASYNYDSLDQRIDDNFTYDLNGNLLKERGIHYAYDSLNRLTSIASPTHKTLLTYDYWNRLLTLSTFCLIDDTWIHQKTEQLLYDHQKELGTAATLRVLNPTKPSEIGATISIEHGSQIYTPIHDLFGNIIALLDSQSNPLESYQYTAFGEEHPFNPSLNPWHYQSKRKIHHLCYFGHRFYHPNLGCWLTPDPLGFSQGPNLYQYNYNNPFRYIDPDGKFAIAAPLIPVILGAATIEEVLFGQRPLLSQPGPFTKGLKR